MSRRIAIVGAGITGLCCAYELAERGHAPVVFERSERVGGAIHTVRRDGFVAEHGPHTFLESNDTVRDLIRRLDLEGERVYATDAATTRFMVHQGQVRAIPASPPALLKTDIYSPAAKLALAREPFVPRRDDGIDESVTNFVTRRLHPDLLHYGVELLVNGIWAGDPDRLSARYAFPKMYALERDYGSLIRGGLARARQGRNPAARRMFSFRDGNQTLVDALAARAGEIRRSTEVRRVTRQTDGWLVDGERFDAVVLTAGAPAYADLQIEDGEPVDFGFMREVVYPSLAVLTLGFRRADVAHALDGFGMLAPAQEGLDLLGALFTSTLFDGRTPPGHVALACFVGGMRRPDLVRLEPAERRERVMRTLRRLLGVRGEPTFAEEVVWWRAIPQYEVGYGRLLARMEALEHKHPGLVIAGNIRGAVAVPDLIERAVQLARRLA